VKRGNARAAFPLSCDPTRGVGEAEDHAADVDGMQDRERRPGEIARAWNQNRGGTTRCGSA
jgi:hypothetical protein